MKRGLSIREVAKRARVSTATVSRTINNPHLVDPVTAARVKQVIGELDYFPDTHARALVSGRSRMLGLIVSDITNPFFPELVKGFSDVSAVGGYDILVGSTDYSSTRMEACVRRMLERKVDGIAVMTSERDQSTIEALARQRVPIAFLDVGPNGKHFRCVEVDYAQGIAEAVDHLMKIGHERLAFIGGRASLPSSQFRRTAFVEQTRCRGLDVREEFLLEGDLTVDGGFVAMQRLLECPIRPTALLAANDLSAIGALRSAHRAGLRVPDDLSIIGFDDIHLAEFTEPPLTTIRLDRQEMANSVFKWLASEIDGEEQEGTESPVLIETRLVLRETTGPVQ